MHVCNVGNVGRKLHRRVLFPFLPFRVLHMNEHVQCAESECNRPSLHKSIALIALLFAIVMRCVVLGVCPGVPCGYYIAAYNIRVDTHLSIKYL